MAKRGTYQGGGEDGEEDAEPENDTVTGGLGKDGRPPEEAVHGRGWSVRSEKA